MLGIVIIFLHRTLFIKLIVSSGGMLVQQLKTTDLNNEKMLKFDGTMVYAQNKRQQVKEMEKSLSHF